MGNISWHFANVKRLSFGVLLSLALGSAAASKNEGALSPKYDAAAGSQRWLTSGFSSYQFKRSAGYQESNAGLGFERRFNSEQLVVGGVYENSVRRTTPDLPYVWTPLRAEPFRSDAAAGLIEGYPELNKGEDGFSLIPVGSLEFKIFSYDAGINLVYIPTVTQRVDGSLALQLKVRLK